MKYFWKIWITTVTIIVLSLGIYAYVHAQNNKAHHESISRTCSSKAFNDTVDYVENKAQTYQLFYSQCMRDHLAAE
jgi:uncharacterized membrane protein YczE